MSATHFAACARIAPNPWKVDHGDGIVGILPYTCHMAAMHWAFMDRGDFQTVAHQRLTVINRAVCPKCRNPTAFMHQAILHQWYGAHFCGGAQQILSRDALYGAVEVGDVLILGTPTAPAHSMVVVGKSKAPGHSWVYIRGFNNVGALGTGAQLQYDPQDRDIDRRALWKGSQFGITGNPVYRIPYVDYSNRAGIVSGQCIGYPMTYRGT